MQPTFPADHHFHRRAGQAAQRPSPPPAEAADYDRRQRRPANDPSDPRSDIL